MTDILSDPGPYQKSCKNNIAILMILGLLGFYQIFIESGEHCDIKKISFVCVLMLFVLLQNEKIIRDRRGQFKRIFSIICAQHFYPVLGNVVHGEKFQIGLISKVEGGDSECKMLIVPSNSNLNFEYIHTPHIRERLP